MKKQSHNSALFWLLARMKGWKRYLGLLVLGNILFAWTIVVFSLGCQGLIDSATASDVAMMKNYGWILLGIVFFRLICRLFNNGLHEYLNGKLTNSIRQDTLDQLLKKEYYHIGRYHSGELVNRMFSDVKIIVDGLLNILPVVANLATRLVGAVVILIRLDSRFTLLFCIVGVGSFLVTRLFRRRIKSLHKNVQEQEGKVHSFLQESIENIRLIKSADMEKKISCQNEAYQNSFFDAQMHRRTYTITSNAGMNLIFQLGYLYALLWGGWQISSHAMSYGTLMAILQLVGQIQIPFSNLSGIVQRYYGMLASAERMSELFQLKDEEISGQEVETVHGFDRIGISNLTFAYDNLEVLKDVNIEIYSGDCVSVTGLSGGGKSTLFLLLLGIYQPKQGEIRICHENMQCKAGKTTRPLFAYVPQGNNLFSGTIRENIAMFCDQASDEEIWKAAEHACIRTFLEEQRDGLDTVIGERGIGLSEGQAQRIAIARALLSGAPVLLLDEATSALDNETEKKVLEHISLLEGKTCIIVTHRKEALKICNRHIHLVNGRMMEKEGDEDDRD